jgi:hypothetical protein
VYLSLAPAAELRGVSLGAPPRRLALPQPPLQPLPHTPGFQRVAMVTLPNGKLGLVYQVDTVIEPSTPSTPHAQRFRFDK